MELEEGCSEDESQPVLRRLDEALYGEGGRYVARALQMFPELKTESQLIRQCLEEE